MTKRATTKAAPPPARPPTPPNRLGAVLGGLVLLVASVLTALAITGISTGVLNQSLARGLRWLVGWGALPLALVGIAGGAMMIAKRTPKRLTVGCALAAEIIALAWLGLFALIGDGTLAWPSASGGAVGWAVALIPSALGQVGGAVLLALVIAACLPTLLGVTAQQMSGHLQRWRDDVAERQAKLESAPPPPRKRATPPMPTATEPRVLVAGRETPAVTPPPARVAPALASVATKAKEVAAKVASPKTPSSKAAAVKAAAPTVTAPAPIATLSTYPLPPMDLLQVGGDNALDPNIAREKARIIERTLKEFGVPASVVQVNQGPAVTQFGVQPGFIENTRSDGEVQQRKVKVNSITSLADDLALALAARSIRIEAPVPGRPYIGIEVPNSDTETVTLRSVLTSEEFKRVKSDLRFALGRDVGGRSVVADLARMPHLLIAGATGSGKSVCVNTIILSYLLNVGPDRLKLLMIDPKMVELIPYNGIPHLIAPVVTEMERAVGALTWAMREMDRRYKLFSEAGKRNHEAYNTWAAANGHEVLPHIVIFIDELADLMMTAADQVERIICRIAQMSRATGMHLIVATQRPSVDVVTGLIKANIPARISFAVASQIDSRVILDSPGAEALLGRGDMLYQSPESSKMQRLQGCFVSDNEVSAVVQHWLRASAMPRQTPSQAAQVATPWDEIVEEIASGDAAPVDDLLAQAIAIVREHKWASTSFLQRKLRIGYTRAARLIDALEEQGIIGPPDDSSNGSRVVLPDARAESER